MPNFEVFRKSAATAGLVTAAILVSACGGGDDGTSGVEATATSARDATAQSTSGLIESPSASSTNYFIDSKTGNDANSGTAATPGSGGIGPWRSLAKLAAASLAPGSKVHLICGSGWGETLRLKSSGTIDSPIAISAYPAGCAERPTISASTYIASTSWSLHQGKIYKAALTTEPLQLVAWNGALTKAHHPNRGFDSARPTSMYLRAAENSDNVMIDGRAASTYVTTGSDLVLPPGATLTAGTSVSIRPNAWTINETTIRSVSGSRITLENQTSYPLTKGWGYFLLGRPWMLDSPGEWYWDAAAKVVYVWMPNGAAPTSGVNATVRQVGIDLNSRKYVSIDGIRILRAGTGIAMRDSEGISVNRVEITDTEGLAIDGSNGKGNLVQASSMIRSGISAVAAGGSTLMRIVGNTIVDAGVIMAGEAVASVPRRTIGAILGGNRTTITGNSITNSGYSGIAAWNENNISGNYIYGACSVLDDCGGIYTSNGEKYTSITGNVVQHTRGNVEADPSPEAVTQAQGIYLDYHASHVTITGNTVVDADHGIQIHISSNNLIQGNKLYGNRKSQIKLNEHSNSVRATGDVFENTITDNQVASTSAEARGLMLLSTIKDTSNFGYFDRNIYFDRIYSRVSSETIPAGRIDYTFASWQAATRSDGSPRNLDADGKATSELSFAPALVTGPNIVPNGNLASATPPWAAFNGTVSRVSCTPGYCASYIAGSKEGTLSAPNFSIKKDQWYRVSVDVLGGADDQRIDMLVRRGGGGSNGYEPLSKTYFTARASRNWTRLTFIFQASTTVNASDPVTLDKGARLDIEHIKPGQTVTVTNAQIVPITSVSDGTKTALLLNVTSSTSFASCPDAESAPATCGLYVRLADSAPISWPYSLAPRSSEIVYTLDPALIDSDADGIANSQDQCPGSPRGAGVNAVGCTIGA